MNREERIRIHEAQKDRAQAALTALNQAIESFYAVQPELSALRAYYESSQWLADFTADEQGLLPQTLQRGILSEDCLYDLLAENDRLLSLLGTAAQHDAQ